MEGLPRFTHELHATVTVGDEDRHLYLGEDRLQVFRAQLERDVGKHPYSDRPAYGQYEPGTATAPVA